MSTQPVATKPHGQTSGVAGGESVDLSKRATFVSPLPSKPATKARGGAGSIASFLHGDTVILRRVQADDVSRHPGSAPSESRLGCRKTLPKDCLESHGIEIIAMRI